MHRQSHAFGIEAGQDITKVASRHREVDCLARLDPTSFHEICIGTEIINDLRHQPAPVDGIGRRQLYTLDGQLFIEGLVSKDLLDATLRIVEITTDSRNIDVAAFLRQHLQLLDPADTAFRIEYHDPNLRHIAEAFQCCLAGITGRSNEDQYIRCFPGLLQRCTHELRQQLQRHVLEGTRRAMPKLQHTDILENRDRCTHSGIKLVVPVGTLHTAFDFVCRIIRQKKSQDLFCPLLIGKILQ